MTFILASNERTVANQLLDITSIRSQYEASNKKWAKFLRKIIAVTKNNLTDVNNAPVIFSPYETVGFIMNLISNTASELLFDIRRLQDSNIFQERDTYNNLKELQIPKISKVDVKGLFLLTAIAAEQNGVFSDK
jgi:hypothetical protein